MIPVMQASALSGLWAAVPTPWRTDGGLDLDAFERNIATLCEVPVDGIYTTDSDGEFYAVERDDFQRLAKSFGRAARRFPVAAAMGVTWSHTAGIIERIKMSVDVGIPLVHVAYPYWMPLAPGDVSRFWDDLASAVPNARWVHYNTGRAHIQMTGRDYAPLTAKFPDQLIGTKIGTINLLEIAELIHNAPQLSHLAGGDYITASAMMLGAKGVCSFWVNTLPQWTRRLVDLCREGVWEEAMAMQKKLLVWEANHMTPLRDAGHLHAVVGKARSALTRFIEDRGITKPPYYPVAPELLRQLQQEFDQYWVGED